jgi:hypothetical protein
MKPFMQPVIILPFVLAGFIYGQTTFHWHANDVISSDDFNSA